MGEGLISRKRAAELRKLKTLVGKETYLRVQGEVWARFVAMSPPVDAAGNLEPFALYGVWDEFVKALRAELVQ